MDFSVGEIGRIFRAYQTQSRIAELNKKENVKTVQTQIDRVSISAEARRLLSVGDVTESQTEVARFATLDDIPDKPETASHDLEAADEPFSGSGPG
jgi:hypothetical protein